MFQQVVHKGGESAIKYIKIFQNSKALEISVGNSYTEDQMMRVFLDNFHKSGKYSDQIEIHKNNLGEKNNSLINNHYLYLNYKFII